MLCEAYLQETLQELRRDASRLKVEFTRVSAVWMRSEAVVDDGVLEECSVYVATAGQTLGFPASARSQATNEGAVDLDRWLHAIRAAVENRKWRKCHKKVTVRYTIGEKHAM